MFFYGKDEGFMKFIIMMLLSLNITFSQVDAVSLWKISRGELELRQDFNSDGKIEYLHGESIIEIGQDSYWMRKGQLVTGNGANVFDFREKMYLNGQQVIEQVNAKFGYIITFGKSENLVSIYISDVFGNKKSDELILEME
jgi:hypothetical protein